MAHQGMTLLDAPTLTEFPCMLGYGRGGIRQVFWSYLSYICGQKVGRNDFRIYDKV